MRIRQPVHSVHARTLDTEGLFQPGQVTLTCSPIDGNMTVSQAVSFAPGLGMGGAAHAAVVDGAPPGGSACENQVLSDLDYLPTAALRQSNLIYTD